MSLSEERTFRKDVTSHKKNREIELGRNQEDRENAVKSMVSAINKTPTSPQLLPDYFPLAESGENSGRKWEKNKAKGVLYEEKQL